MAEIPALSELPARPRRIILHWTGGGPRANSTDRKAYHYIVEHDGTIVQGVHPVARNMQRVWGESYARHTGGFNSFSVGISFAGMMNFTSPARPGSVPLKPGQVLAGLRFAAECCHAWELDALDPAQVFHHREAWELHGVKGTRNHTKLDITHLPFMPELRRTETGPWMRSKIAELQEIAGRLDPEPGMDPLPAPVPVPGERRWSPRLGWIRLVRYVSDREWFFRAESRPDAPITRAGARWSEMPRRPPV
jgi:hypothetical protein